MQMRFPYTGPNGLKLGSFYESDLRKLGKILEKEPYSYWPTLVQYKRDVRSQMDSKSGLVMTAKRDGVVKGYIVVTELVRGGHAIAHAHFYPGAFGDVVALGRLACKLAFDRYDIRKISMTIFKPNRKAIIAALRVGFKQEGLLRKAVIAQGAPTDVVIVGLLKEEFE